MSAYTLAKNVWSSFRPGTASPITAAADKEPAATVSAALSLNRLPCFKNGPGELSPSGEPYITWLLTPRIAELLNAAVARLTMLGHNPYLALADGRRGFAISGFSLERDWLYVKGRFTSVGESLRDRLILSAPIFWFPHVREEPLFSFAGQTFRMGPEDAAPPVSLELQSIMGYLFLEGQVPVPKSPVPQLVAAWERAGIEPPPEFSKSRVLLDVRVETKPQQSVSSEAPVESEAPVKSALTDDISKAFQAYGLRGHMPDPYRQLKAADNRIERKFETLLKRHPHMAAALEKQQREEEHLNALHVRILTAEPKHSFLYLPAGTHLIKPLPKGESELVTTDEETASALELHRRAVVAGNNTPYIDFNHECNPEHPAFWPVCFYWFGGSRPGVYVCGVFSEEGKKRVLERREFKALSPHFKIDKGTPPPHRIVCASAWPDPCMGGFVKRSAFGETLKLQLSVSPEISRKTI